MAFFTDIITDTHLAILDGAVDGCTVRKGVVVEVNSEYVVIIAEATCVEVGALLAIVNLTGEGLLRLSKLSNKGNKGKERQE